MREEQAAAEIAKVIDAKVEQKVWEQSEAQAKDQWRQCANLKLDKNGDPVKPKGVDDLTTLEKYRQAAQAQVKQLEDTQYQLYKQPYKQPYPTYTRLGWSCPNCGRCYGPHINSCTQCVGTYQWPYGYQPVQRWPVQPSPWWQAPPLAPFTWTNRGTVTVTASPGLGGIPTYGGLGVIPTDGPEPTSRLDV